MSHNYARHHDNQRCDCETSAGYRHIGQVREWRYPLDAFDRFRRVELLDNSEALDQLWDVVLHHRLRPDVRTIVIVLNSFSDTGVFLHVSLLQDLAAGCKELLLMAEHDRLGEFRGTLCDGWKPGHRQPLLSDYEDHVLRLMGNNVIKLVESVTKTVGSAHQRCAGTMAPWLRPDCSLPRARLPDSERKYQSNAHMSERASRRLDLDLSV